jgi:hypothetical protein
MDIGCVCMFKWGQEKDLGGIKIFLLFGKASDLTLFIQASVGEFFSLAVGLQS